VDDSKQLVHGEHRRRLVRQLTAILGDARALAAAFDPALDIDLAADVDLARLTKATRVLAGTVAVELPDLIASAEAATTPESRFLREVLEPFTVLREWATLRRERTNGTST
jgi:hypothetical protein